MKHPARNLVLALVIAIGTSAAAVASAPDQPQPAKWVSRDVNFTFMGLTAHYTCDGLRENVVTILHALGAGKQDFKVETTPCVAGGTDLISRAPGVRGHISVLVPATADEISRGDPAVVPAHWHNVDLMHARDLNAQRGQQCELLEQSKGALLPMFTTRNLEFASDCVPHQTLGGMTFKVDVLQADSKPAS